jgi:LmbE family N-acetylglucosaminyl deacetylase
MTTQASPRPSFTSALVPAKPPRATRVLAVTARPGQESAELGALLYEFGRAGASVRLLCLTGQGPRSGGPLARTAAVEQAAAVLGVGYVAVAGYRHSELPQLRPAELVGRIGEAVSEHSADLVLVIAPEAGDIADAAVARATMAVALQAGVPVAARTAPHVSGALHFDLGPDAETVRSVQRAAVASHAPDQAVFPGLINRIGQLGPVETLRWLVSPARIPAPRAAADETARSAHGAPAR